MSFPPSLRCRQLRASTLWNRSPRKRPFGCEWQVQSDRADLLDCTISWETQERSYMFLLSWESCLSENDRVATPHFRWVGEWLIDGKDFLLSESQCRWLFQRHRDRAITEGSVKASTGGGPLPDREVWTCWNTNGVLMTNIVFPLCSHLWLPLPFTFHSGKPFRWLFVRRPKPAENREPFAAENSGHKSSKIRERACQIEDQYVQCDTNESDFPRLMFFYVFWCSVYTLCALCEWTAALVSPWNRWRLMSKTMYS